MFGLASEIQTRRPSESFRASSVAGLVSPLVGEQICNNIYTVGALQGDAGGGGARARSRDAVTDPACSSPSLGVPGTLVTV